MSIYSSYIKNQTNNTDNKSNNSKTDFIYKANFFVLVRRVFEGQNIHP